MKKWFSVVIAFLVFQMVALGVNVSSVKITPLGSHDGEFCRFDRALILEDPNGTRLVYDVGRTLAGAEEKLDWELRQSNLLKPQICQYMFL